MVVKYNGFVTYFSRLFSFFPFPWSAHSSQFWSIILHAAAILDCEKLNFEVIRVCDTKYFSKLNVILGNFVVEKD